MSVQITYKLTNVTLMLSWLKVDLEGSCPSLLRQKAQGVQILRKHKLTIPSKMLSAALLWHSLQPVCELKPVTWVLSKSQQQYLWTVFDPHTKLKGVVDNKWRHSVSLTWNVTPYSK